MAIQKEQTKKKKIPEWHTIKVNSEAFVAIQHQRARDLANLKRTNANEAASDMIIKFAHITALQ